jgi:hypothetical protein
VCVNNVQDFPGLGQDYVCQRVLILATTDGIMTVEGLSTQGGVRPLLEIESGSGATCCNYSMGNPTSIPVTAGTEVRVNIEMVWGSTTSQSFAVHTSMASR